MTTEMILYIALIMYVLIISFSFTFKMKWLIIVAGLIWFIPITLIDNGILQIISAIMMLGHFVLGFSNEKEESDF